MASRKRLECKKAPTLSEKTNRESKCVLRKMKLMKNVTFCTEGNKHCENLFLKTYKKYFEIIITLCCLYPDLNLLPMRSEKIHKKCEYSAAVLLYILPLQTPTSRFVAELQIRLCGANQLYMSELFTKIQILPKIFLFIIPQPKRTGLKSCGW